MSVEFVSSAFVRDVTARIAQARQRAVTRSGALPAQPDARYWESVFETNAAEVLTELPGVTLGSGCVVRYAFFGQHGRDLHVRPFVAHRGTDVAAIRRLLDWHPPPDAINQLVVPTQDVALLYGHFAFPHTVSGIFEYWLAMQELWASAQWTHAHLIADAGELSTIASTEGWELLHRVEACEPAIVRTDEGARLAVLVHSPLHRFTITLQQIEIGADQALRYAEPILVAAGPRGYAS